VVRSKLAIDKMLSLFLPSISISSFRYIHIPGHIVYTVHVDEPPLHIHLFFLWGGRRGEGGA